MKSLKQQQSGSQDCSQDRPHDGPHDRAHDGVSPAALARASGASACVRADRRGSFLVIVVGTLALLAVITIVYVSLGNQDSRTRAAVSKREQLDQVPTKFGAYLGDIIANDVVATAWDGQRDSGNRPILTRETTEIPGTSWKVYSNRTAGNFDTTAEKFNPEGTVLREAALAVVPNNAAVKEIQASDPFLASTAPIWLNWHAAAAQPQNPFDELRTYLHDVDWAAISNVSPDGRGVSLWNLRGNWSAQSGFGSYPNPAGGPALLRISEGLSLYDGQGVPTLQSDFGVAPGGGQVGVEQQRPGFFFNRQQKLFQPARVDPRIIVGARRDTWDNPFFKLYQFADADGDGMLDSRWQEMVDASTLAGGVPIPRSVLDLPSKYRWFFATRIIDLSALVNVNFATDLTSSPTFASGVVAPLGMGPHEIDLRRVLTMADGIANFNDLTAPGPTWSGYNAILLGDGNYGGIVPAPANAAANAPNMYTQYGAKFAYEAGRHGYTALRLALATGRDIPSRSPDGTVVYAGPNLGSAGTDRMTTLSGFLDVMRNGIDEGWNFSNNASTNSANTDPYAFRRFEYFQDQSERRGDTSFENGNGVGNVGLTLRGRFGIDDLAELLARHGANDPEMTSTLERVVDGRYAMPATNAAAPFAAGPLRSNRPLVSPTNPLVGVEMPMFDGSNNLAQSFWQFATGAGGVPAGSLTDRYLRQAALDPRRNLTTLSSARELRATRVSLLNLDTLDVNEAKIDAKAALERGDVAALYRGYADGLALFSDIDAAWGVATAAPLPPAFGQNRTLFYGHGGPELGLLTAAHMAVNMQALADPYGAPVAATVKLASAFAPLDSEPINDRTMQEFPWWFPPDSTVTPPTAATPGPVTRLVPQTRNAAGAVVADVQRLAPAALDTLAPAANVFGIQPQPFLVRMSTMTVYSDTRGLIPGDPDPDPSDRVAIKSGLENDNEDVLYRVIAFELHNPFSEDIVLGKRNQTTGNATMPFGAQGGFEQLEISEYRSVDFRGMEDYYYIDLPGVKTGPSTFDNKRFLLLDLREQVSDFGTSAEARAKATINPITIPAGKSVVCAALSRPASVIKKLLAGRGATSLPPDIKQLLTTAFGYDNPSVGQNVFWITEMNSSNGQLQYFNANPAAAVTPRHKELLPGDPGVSTNPNNERCVTLRRVLRAPGESEGGVATPITITRPSATTGASVTVQFTPFKANRWENDLVLDRMRFNQQLNMQFANAAGQSNREIPIPNTDAFLAVPANSAYEDGFTFVLSATVHRAGELVPSDPGSMSIPAFCIEPKYTAGWNFVKSSLTVDASERSILPLGASESNATPPAWPAGSTPSLRYGSDWGISQNFADWVAFMIPSIGTPSVTSESSLLSHMSKSMVREKPLTSTQTQVPDREICTAETFDPSGTSTEAWYVIDESPAARGAFPIDPPLASPTAHPDGQYTNFSLAPAPPPMVASPQWAQDLRPDFSFSPLMMTSGPKLVDIMRLTDLLLPMGLGPMEVPFDAAGVLRDNSGASGPPTSGTYTRAMDEFNARWTTLGEAFAIASGYQNPASTSPPANAHYILGKAQDSAMLWDPNAINGGILGPVLITESSSRQVFNRGNLWTDRFVPFVDQNADRRFDPANADVRRSAGIPCAAAVLDQFAVHHTDLEQKDYLARGIEGRININTAPLAVLRTLPMAAPMAEALLPVAGVSYGDGTWWNTDASIGVAAHLTDGLDLAAVMASYRDQVPIRVREATFASPDYNFAQPFIDFSNPDILGNGLPANARQPRGQSLIPAISSANGVGSVGELLAMRYLDIAPPLGTPDTTGLPVSLDFSGHDPDPAAAMLYPSSDPRLEPFGKKFPTPVNAAPTADDGIANEYDESLIPAGVMAASVTTRSDTFACWFVVAGFTKEDAEGTLGGLVATANNEGATPLIPSVARRFLMVVDRSNVTRKGDKPKVVLFKEVPFDTPW